MTGDRRGFALLAILLVLALLGGIVVELALSMRLEAAAARSYKEGIVAGHLAEAAVEQAIREIIAESTVQGTAIDGTLVFYRTLPGESVLQPLPPMRRSRAPLGAGEFSYRISDEDARINLNVAPPDQVDRLLIALDVDHAVRDTIRDSLLDWKDEDEQHRINGAESEDTYLEGPLPYRAANGPLQDIAELLQIKGVTPELYRGTPERAGLVDLVSVHSRTSVNINTAAAPVLKAVGLSDAEVSDIFQARVLAPFATVPGRYGGRGLGVGSQTFRIEAEGRVAGEPRARLVAIVQRGNASATSAVALPGALPAPPVTILSWRPGSQP